MATEPSELRKVMGCFATGVTIITTRDQSGKPYGLTANAVTSLSLSPPLLLICVDRKAETYPHFFDSKTFVLNILAEVRRAERFDGEPLLYYRGQLGWEAMGEEPVSPGGVPSP